MYPPAATVSSVGCDGYPVCNGISLSSKMDYELFTKRKSGFLFFFVTLQTFGLRCLAEL